MIRGLAQKSFKKYKMKDCESRSDERKGEFRNIHAGFMFHFATVGTMVCLLQLLLKQKIAVRTRIFLLFSLKTVETSIKYKALKN